MLNSADHFILTSAIGVGIVLLAFPLSWLQRKWSNRIEEKNLPSSDDTVIRLEPDIQEMFPNSESVNRALRAVGELVKTARPKSV